jgi:outer membrane lipoprotein SlyB
MSNFPLIVRLCMAGMIGCIITACASQSRTTSSTTGTTLVEVGEVTNVRDVTLAGGRTSGAGSFLGSVVGAIAGSQVGGGYGRTAAAIGGTVAGGVAGERVESAGNTSKVTELSVRFDNGGIRTYNVDPNENFRVGDKVKVVTSHGTTRVTH